MGNKYDLILITWNWTWIKLYVKTDILFAENKCQQIQFNEKMGQIYSLQKFTVPNHFFTFIKTKVHFHM